MIFSESADAAKNAGILVWNHLNRLDSAEDTRVMGAIGAVGSLVAAGVNLALGGRNMKHNATNDHSVTLKVNNYTPYTIMIRMIGNVTNSSFKNCIIETGKSVDVELGTRNYAGYDNRNAGPAVFFTLTDGTNNVPIKGTNCTISS